MNGPCDVLHVLWSGRFGGVERQVETIVRAASERGRLTQRACFLEGRGPIRASLEADGLAIGLGFHDRARPAELRQLVSALRDLRPRVLHFHAHAIAGFLAAGLSLTRTAWVYTEHDPRAFDRDAKFRLLYAIVRARCSRVVAVTPAMARTIAVRGVDPAVIVEIPNCVTVPIRRNRPAGEPGPPVIGVVARLEPEKRIELFIDVLAELRRRGTDCTGLIVGDGSRRADLVRYAEERGLARSVQFAGAQASVAPWLDRLDLFLSTSARETFGVAALEAMARSVPVVAMTCEGGLPDLVTGAGVLVPGRDVGLAADAVSRLISSPEERARLGSLGAAVAAGHLPEVLLERLEDLYAGVMGERSRSAS